MNGSRRRTPTLVASLAALSACSLGSEAGPRLYVTSGFTDEVLILDPDDGRIVAERTLDRRPGERDEPHDVAVALDGRHWYATLAQGEPTLWKFETRGDRLVGRVSLPLNGAARIGISPDGQRAIIPDYWLGGLGAMSEVAIVELGNLSVIADREVCAAPHHAAWSPSGSRIGIACALSDELVILDGRSFDEVARFTVGSQAGDPPNPGNPRAQPMNIAWSPTGAVIFVSLMREGRAAAYTLGGEVLWSARTGDSPAQIALTPDGATLVVANRGGVDGTLTLVDAETGSVRTLSLAGFVHPHGLAIHPGGEVVYVTYEGSTTSQGGVVAVELASGAVLWQTEAGVFTLGVAYLPGAGAP